MPDSVSYRNLFRGDTAKWLEDYHHSLTEVISYVQNFEGLKTHLGINNLRTAKPYLHASMLLSDLTSIAVSAPGKENIKICPDLAGSRITIPNRIIAEQGIDITTEWKSVGYTQSSGKEARKFISEIRAAIIEGQIIVRPDRIALFKNGEGNFQAVNCEPDCGKNDWIVSEQNKNERFLPVKVVSERTSEINLSLPYLKNVSTQDFLKVLRMNDDCIATIRAALRTATKEVHKKSEAEYRDIRADIIDPKLEELRRSFKRIVKSAAIKIGATGVGTIVASLSAVAGNFEGMAIPSILGGGFGLLTLGKEYSNYSSQLDYLKDNPYYLFWKMKAV